MLVLGNLLIALVVVTCDAGVVHDPQVLEYGVKVVPEVAYKPVIGYQEASGYVVPKPLPVGYGLPGPVPVGGVVKDIGALPYGAVVGGLKPFGSYRSLFANRFPYYSKEEVVAPRLAYGVAPAVAPVKEVREFIPPVALKEYSAPVVLKEYAPKLVLNEYTAPVALKGYGAPAVGYPVGQGGYLGQGYAGYKVPAVGYGAPGVIGNGYVDAVPVKGYPAPIVAPKQGGYDLIKKSDW